MNIKWRENLEGHSVLKSQMARMQIQWAAALNYHTLVDWLQQENKNQNNTKTFFNGQHLQELIPTVTKDYQICAL